MAITHPDESDDTRAERLEQAASRYWWLGFLGFWNTVHPALTAFYVAFLLIPVWLLSGWVADSASPTAWISTRSPTGFRGRLGAVWGRVHPVAALQAAWHRLATAVVRGRGS